MKIDVKFFNSLEKVEFIKLGDGARHSFPSRYIPF